MNKKPDWRNPNDYKFIDDINKYAVAWEFLRRNPTYSEDYKYVTAIYAEGEKKYGPFNDNEEAWRNFEKVIIEDIVDEHGDTMGSWNGRVFDKNVLPSFIYLEPYRAGFWGLKNKMANPNSDKTPRFRYAYRHPKYITKDEDIDDYLINKPSNDYLERETNNIALGFDLNLPIQKQIDKAKYILQTQQKIRSKKSSKNKPLDQENNNDPRRLAKEYLRILDAREELRALNDISMYKKIAQLIYGHTPTSKNFEENAKSMRDKIESAENVMEKGYIRILRGNTKS